MLRKTRVFVVVAAVAVALFGSQQPARAGDLPSSMSATGDSITRAFDVTLICLLRDCPQYSWATGDRPEVNSHYLRILAANPAIQGRAYNDARTGARMNDLDRQLLLAAGRGVEYVTIAIGANDVCTRTAAEMTPTAVFRAQFEQAMADFTRADPDALIYLSSVPNIYHLWAILHDNPQAQLVWSTFQICQSMLSSSGTEEDRQAVLDQVVADNQALADVCALYTACLWDEWAAFNYEFVPADVSSLDYFHPSVQGQASIAELTWAAGYWPAV